MAKHSKTKLPPTERIAYSVKEVAEMVGVPPSTIRSRIHAGDIAIVTGFGPWRIAKKELDRILKDS